MAKADFIPELWAATFLRAYEAQTSLSLLVNRTYESELAGGPGDKVKISQHTLNPTVGDYTVDTDISAAEVADGNADLEITLDKQKYWHIYVDDIDAVQSAPDIMAETVRKGAYEMAKQVEDDLFTEFNTAVIAANRVSDTGKSSGVTDGHTAKLIELAMKMDEADVPVANRWLLISPLFMARLRSYIIADDSHGFTPETDQAMLSRGVMGHLLGFRLVHSNRIPRRAGAAGATAEFDLYAGIGDEVAFVSQLTELESYRPERRFGDAVKALQVYGSAKLRDLWALRIKGNAV